MSTTGTAVRIQCRGHPNIRASHAKTFELTRDPSITSAGTCIVGVDAKYDEAALLKLRGPVTVTLRCGNVEDTAAARINPKYLAGAPLIFRRSPTPEPRTFCIGADKGSNVLSRDLIEALRQPGAMLDVIIEPAESVAAMGEGLLSVVGLPIGNLDDLSPRALAVLQSADLVLSEDTRTTRTLLADFGVTAKLTSYHDHNECDRVPEILEKLRSGTRIALVSEAGMPLISDPGFHLVRAVRQDGLPVTVVPGPDAVTSALAVAGLPTDDFRFLGFLPRKTGQRRQRLEELRAAAYTTVLFEAPHRIDKTLTDINRILGDRPVALCRNLTKFGEKILTGSAAEISAAIAAGEAVNGELVLVVAGGDPVTGQSGTDEQDGLVHRLLEILVEGGLPTKVLGDALAKVTGVSRRDGFNRVLNIKKSFEES